MKLSECDEVISVYKTYISDLWYRWPQVRSFLRPPQFPIISQWVKINSVTFTFAQAYLSGIISYRTVVDNKSKNLHCLPLERSFEVTRGHQPSFAKTFWSKRDRGDWGQYVRPGLANRLICNMTHFGHHVTLAWLDLRSNIDLDLSKSFYIWFDAP